jgi:RNA polymerase-binding transcription factor DksA
VEEDILTRKRDAIGAGRYVFCTVCGSPMLRVKSKLVPGEELGEIRNEQAELCASCAALVRSGEYVPPDSE